MKHPRTRCCKVMSVLSWKGKDISKGFLVCAHFPKCLIMVLDYEQPLEACESVSPTHTLQGIIEAWLNSTFFAPVYESLPEGGKKSRQKPLCNGVSLQASRRTLFGVRVLFDTSWNLQSDSVIIILLHSLHRWELLSRCEGSLTRDSPTLIFG